VVVLILVLRLCLLFRYALKVGEISQPVFTDSGIHLILRTG